MSAIDQKECAYKTESNQDSCELAKKKKQYSNLVSLQKSGITNLSKEIEKNILNIPSLQKGEALCDQEKKLSENFVKMNELEEIKELADMSEFSNTDGFSNDLMMNVCDKTPCNKGNENSCNYIKGYSSNKKRVYTPNKFNKSKLYNYEDYENKISIFTTPKRRYTSKRRINEGDKKKDNDSVCSRSIKRKSIYNELVHLHTPIKDTKKYLSQENDEDIKQNKWIIDESNMNELPEKIKNEYVSYLHSPLKRSERLIKSKINKMLNENVENLKNEQLRGTDSSNGNNSNSLGSSEPVQSDFIPEDEEKCWDDYYTQNADKVRPFTGFTTELAVNIINELLKGKIKKIKIDNKEYSSPISENDPIMEIGHGNHPMAVQMFEKWGTVGRYIGAEFSGLASQEALKCPKLKNLFLKRKVEFIKVLDMKYYKDDYLNAVVTQSNISEPNTKTDFIKMHTFKYIFSKSTLDYITCRMDNIGNCFDWEEDLQISPSVVEMFNSLSDSLQNCKSSKGNSCIIFVEPNNSSKFRDHILTIFKVIYTATFKYDSSAKYLRLAKINNGVKACGYLIEKRNEVYEDFEQMKHEFLKLIIKSAGTKNIDEADWYLPSNPPKKWTSDSPNDIEYLVKLDANRI
ncbi:conserved Plasmodium protein, unknown function [Plasmodium vinckei vinckei]|uniref:Methyltransferase n=1 Tax=Plasmodium vinckei vinckei TaxID=54757 RepID=A0A449BYV1_PLAVN|nr:conserved Plasmodium protein, unknown function [Plasmodium vinckei vinckei]KEG04965.1 hypothetical protein YYE_00541 [Plasmodium vinckei vinckei]VEV58614.1 conserved Plasmodium protein, unknown function [Plasmodium vinckei vinckei]